MTIQDITEERTIRNREGYNEVVKKIMNCLRIEETEASKIYTDSICLSGIAPYDFYDVNQRNLKTIRFYAPKACKAMIYIAFISENYDDGSEDSEISYETDDIWTIKTPYVYQQVLIGQVTKKVLESYLTLKSSGEYIPIFINTLILA